MQPSPVQYDIIQLDFVLTIRRSFGVNIEAIISGKESTELCSKRLHFWYACLGDTVQTVLLVNSYHRLQGRPPEPKYWGAGILDHRLPWTFHS